MQIQERYQQVLELSREMLAAGRLQDWDHLADLEARRSALLKESPDAPPPPSADEIISLIREIQACDAELKETLTTTQAQIRTLLRIPPP